MVEIRSRYRFYLVSCSLSISDRKYREVQFWVTAARLTGAFKASSLDGSTEPTEQLSLCEMDVRMIVQRVPVTEFESIVWIISKSLGRVLNCTVSPRTTRRTK